MSDQPELIPACEPGRNTHCWHRSPAMHKIKLHADVRCCFCGLDKCVKLRSQPPKGHGAQTPGAEYVMVVDNPAVLEAPKPDAEPNTQG